jgi:hypothetical protein
MTTTATIDGARTKLAQALKAARATHDAEYPKLQRVVADGMDQRRDIQTRFEGSAAVVERQIAAARRTMLDLDEQVGTAEFALRRSADPRLALLAANLAEHYDTVRRRGSGEPDVVLAVRERTRAAIARIEALQVDVGVKDIDAEVERILATAGVRGIELEQLNLGWRA